MDDKLRLHVSRNRKAPRLETTDAENMIMTLPLLRDKVESWKASNSGSEVPVPGSSVWVTQIVGAVITDFQRRKGKFAVLFHNEPSVIIPVVSPKLLALFPWPVTLWTNHWTDPGGRTSYGELRSMAHFLYRFHCHICPPHCSPRPAKQI